MPFKVIEGHRFRYKWWLSGGKRESIRTVLCCIVYWSCAQS